MRVSKSKIALLTAAVAATLVASQAQAAINLVPATPVGSVRFASELTVTAGALTLTNNGNIFDIGTGAGTAAATGVPLGVGMTAGSGVPRFIKLTLTNAKFAGAFNAGGVLVTTAAGAANNFSAVSVATGGLAGSTFVILQITGNAGGHSQTDIVQIAMPNLTVANTSSAVSVTYENYDSLSNASSSTGAIASATKSGTILSFAPMLAITQATTPSQTITAISSYKNLAVTATNTATRGAVADTLFSHTARLDNTGTSVANFAGYLGAYGTQTLTGDFGGAAANSSVSTRTNATADCSGAVAVDTASAVTASSATIAWGTAVAGVLAFQQATCYTVNGTYQMPTSTYTSTMAPTVLAASAFTLPTYSTNTSATWTRDGVTLESPWTTSTTGYISRFFLRQSTPVDVPFTATVFNANGPVTGGTLTGILPSGKETKVDLATLLPADTTSAPGPYYVSFVVNANTASVQGTYVLTTPSGTVTNTPLIRPASN